MTIYIETVKYMFPKQPEYTLSRYGEQSQNRKIYGNIGSLLGGPFYIVTKLKILKQRYV